MDCFWLREIKCVGFNGRFDLVWGNYLPRRRMGIRKRAQRKWRKLYSCWCIRIVKWLLVFILGSKTKIKKISRLFLQLAIHTSCFIVMILGWVACLGSLYCLPLLNHLAHKVRVCYFRVWSSSQVASSSRAPCHLTKISVVVLLPFWLYLLVTEWALEWH